MELHLRLGDSQRARDVARACRRSGAVLIRQENGEIWAVWPDDEPGRLAADQARELAGEAPGRLRAVRADDPREIWGQAQAEEIAPNLSLAPAWMGLPAGPARLIIDPLTAFGAGDHPSTRLNLKLLAGLLADDDWLPPAHWLADLGCGSGILALGMALLGRRPVLAVDPEPAARRAVTRNQSLNPTPGRLVRFILGDHRCLRGPFGLVAANLPAGIQLITARAAVRSLAPGARLVLSGFRREQADQVIQAFTELGLAVLARDRELDWVGLVMSPAGR